MAKSSKKERVIALLIYFNRLILRITRLKLRDRQALGLLAEAMQINKQMLSLLKEDKISLLFVRQTFSVILQILIDIVSKWLFRYNLKPILAF